MTIYLGADHAGYELKEQVKKYLEEKGLKSVDLGTFNLNNVDYPDIAREVAEKVLENHDAKGILMCGSGQGMCMTANKVPGIRAALCEDAELAKLARAHNDANILCFGARRLSFDQAKEIVEVFLNTPFEGGRHEARVKKVG